MAGPGRVILALRHVTRHQAGPPAADRSVVLRIAAPGRVTLASKACLIQSLGGTYNAYRARVPELIPHPYRKQAT